MKAFWSAMLAMVVIAAVSGFILNQFGMSAGDATSAASVRLN